MYPGFGPPHPAMLGPPPGFPGPPDHWPYGPGPEFGHMPEYQFNNNNEPMSIMIFHQRLRFLAFLKITTTIQLTNNAKKLQQQQ